MNKRGIKLFSILLTVFSLLSFTVRAAREVKFTELIQSMGRFIFEDFARMGSYGFKFLLWLALFTLFDFGMRRGFGQQNRRVTGMISFVLSLAVIILMPGSAVILILSAYTYVVIFALGFIVPLILTWVLFTNFPNNDTMSQIIKTVGLFIIGGAILWLSANIELVLTSTAGVV